MTTTFTETGLPSGASWRVSTWDYPGGVGIPSTVSSVGSSLNISLDAAMPSGFSVWTATSAVPGSVWFGSPSLSSPIDPATTPSVAVAFAQAPISSLSFDLHVTPIGLPSGLLWAVRLGTSTYGELGPTAEFPLAGGSAIQFNASPVYALNGTEFVPREYDVLPFAGASVWSNSTAAEVTVGTNASTCVVVEYSMKYRLTVSASAGGTASPGTQWLDPGSVVNLSAVPGPGYRFVNWTGQGNGSIDVGSPNASVTLSGPLWELATFRPIYYSVTVTVSGLPSGEAFSVLFGGSLYGSRTGSVLLTNLIIGYFGFSVPYSYSNTTASERYVARSVTSDLSLQSNGTYFVYGNGTIHVVFGLQYGLLISAVGPGTVAPSPGAYWADAGLPFALAAVPNAGYGLTGWSGSGPGAYSGSAPNFLIYPSGPINETARFGAPLPTPTYSLRVSETGLPAGSPWSVAVAGFGASGTSTALTIVGVPSGVYQLFAPPVYEPAAGGRLVVAAQAGYLAVDGNLTANVSFGWEYSVTLVTGSGGTTASVPDWVPAGTDLPFAASPDSGFSFVGWTGTVSTGSNSLTIHVTGPITERAEFQALPAAGGVSPVAIAGLLALAAAAVGLGGAWLVWGRPRSK